MGNIRENDDVGRQLRSVSEDEAVLLVRRDLLPLLHRDPARRNVLRAALVYPYSECQGTRALQRKNLARTVSSKAARLREHLPGVLRAIAYRFNRMPNIPISPWP